MVIKIENRDFNVDDENYVRFGDVAISLLQQQCQYASRYTDGKIEGYPNLGQGMRFKGDSGNYHSLKIHKDDIKSFVQKVREYRQNQ